MFLNCEAKSAEKPSNQMTSLPDLMIIPHRKRGGSIDNLLDDLDQDVRRGGGGTSTRPEGKSAAAPAGASGLRQLSVDSKKISVSTKNLATFNKTVPSQSKHHQV